MPQREAGARTSAFVPPPRRLIRNGVNHAIQRATKTAITSKAGVSTALCFRVAAQNRWQILRKGRPRDHYIASLFLRGLLQIGLDVRNESNQANLAGLLVALQGCDQVQRLNARVVQ